MNQKKTTYSFGTHDGTFHADEVSACALLLLYKHIDLKSIVRTRENFLLEQCEYVCDVGGIYDPSKKLFDHHQVEYQGHLSSAGMILLYLKEIKDLSQKEYDFFNELLILGVDAHDNGKDIQVLGYCSYSQIISSFNPIRHEESPEKLDAAFKVAVRFALNFLKRSLKKFKYIQSCRKIVAKAMEQCVKNGYNFLFFDENIPWLESFFELGGEHHPAKFVIMPSHPHWKLRGIPPSLEKRMEVRMPLPKTWAGHLENDLKRISGINGAIFCHKGRFISVWETKEDALKALELVKEA